MAISFLLFVVITFAAVGYTNCWYFEEPIAELKCYPGKTFVYDHNNCKCNGEGSEITCDRGIYTTVTPEFRVNQLQNISVDCLPGKSFEHLCRQCVCDERGEYASCIRTKCSQEKSAILETPEQCIPGTVFKNGCNGCICGADGKAACTNIDCNEVSRPGGIRCIPDSFVVYECNDCQCTHDGRDLDCYRMGCNEHDPLVHKHILNVTMSCEASKSFDYNCHQCMCDENGNYAICSGIECPRRFPYKQVKDTTEKCNPGMIFANDCNLCICDRNGKGVCTTLSCDISYKFKYDKYLL